MEGSEECSVETITCVFSTASLLVLVVSTDSETEKNSIPMIPHIIPAIAQTCLCFFVIPMIPHTIAAISNISPTDEIQEKKSPARPSINAQIPILLLDVGCVGGC